MKRAVQPRIIRRTAGSRLPTRWGTFQAIGYEQEIVEGSGQVESAVALVMGEMNGNAPLLRVHSQCVTGELLGSLRCDCREQLELAMCAIAREGSGVLIYEQQEGRGIGLIAKLEAYALQDAGLDTVEANHALGFASDCRDFHLPVAILRDLDIPRVRLLTNNPSKIRALIDGGVEVVEQISCEAPLNPHSFRYLHAKKEKMNHRLRLGELSRAGSQGSPAARFHGESAFASIATAIRELRAGHMIVVVDDEDRENEGDLTMAAELVTPEAINFMATYGRGLICLALTGEKLDELNLPPMVTDNSALGGTGFAVSIDARGPGVTTGISAHDRAQTIRTAITRGSDANEFARPGHVFPLRSCAGGVLQRPGHTEAAVDLARIAGLHPSGVICEILNDDGGMARVPDLVRFCEAHNLKMITIADLARYRRRRHYQGLRPAVEGLLPASIERDMVSVGFLGHDRVRRRPRAGG
jgi:3,4-dihydroxy 2-butanone 4-phosphate synthase/GTP cyclohydrolase II